MKHIVSLSCLVIAFLLNPLWGCGGASEPQFEFGEQEMAQYAEGSWSGHMVYPDGEETDFELVIERSTHDTRGQGLDDQEYRTIEQPSCNDNIRHFVASAQACGGVNKTILAIEGHLTTEDGRYDDKLVQGELVVWGYELNNAEVWLDLGDGLEMVTECDEQQACSEGALLEASENKNTYPGRDSSAWAGKQAVTMEKT